MVALQKIEPSMFSKIYPLLREQKLGVSEDNWRQLFDHQWNQSSSYCGYGLFDGDTAVGFLGMTFSQRQIAKQKELFCNLTSWVVKTEYRNHSLSMIMPAMRLKDHTITDLSATERVAPLMERLGFKPLDTSVRALFPYGTPTKGEPQIYDGDEIATLPLGSSDLATFADHQPYANCHQLVLQTEQDYCHVLYTLNIHPILSYCHIQSISNTPLFEHHQAVIRCHILRKTRVRLIIVDSRLVTSINLPFSYKLPLATPRFYRSQRLQPDQIDNAYSELILLGINTNFGLRKLLLRAFTPSSWYS